MSVRVSSVLVLSYVGSGLAMGVIPCPRSPTDCKIHSSRLILIGNGPEDLIRKAKEGVCILFGCVHFFVTRRVMYVSFMKCIKQPNLI
jgi:hypothetical protein